MRHFLGILALGAGSSLFTNWLIADIPWALTGITLMLAGIWAILYSDSKSPRKQRNDNLVQKHNNNDDSKENDDYFKQHCSSLHASM